MNEEQLFNKGEKVLCYEPDRSKARVLYDSKVLAVYERKDERKLRYYEYKIHFQGWNSSWDRNVRVSQLLKDHEENRRLQRELAEDAQLQKSGGYSYKDTKTPTTPAVKKKRLGRGGHSEDYQSDALDISLGNQQMTLTPQQPKSAARKQLEKNSAAASTASQAVNVPIKNSRNARQRADDDLSSALPSLSKDTPRDDSDQQQENRVLMRVSERLQNYMTYDYTMISKFGKRHALPSRIPIITILESFVKQRAVELAISIKQETSRARNTSSRNARMELEYDRVMSNVCMLKEVVDGLRIYFEFHLENHLLYKDEKAYVLKYIRNDNNMRKCSDILKSSYDINPSCDTELNEAMNAASGCEGSILGGYEYETQLQRCLLYIVQNSGKDNIAYAYDQRISPYTAAYKLPEEMRGFLCETFNWRLLCPESPPEKSMVFGAQHLARLLIKMPAFLNATDMPNKKLQDLLGHLDTFTNYLENHKEWFDKDNYLP